jgi:hypothetical protein
MTVSGIQTHYQRCPSVNTASWESGASKLYALDNQSMPSHWLNKHKPDSRGHATGSLSLTRQEIVPMSSFALKSIYVALVYLFKYTTLPDLWLQARCRPSAIPSASRADSLALMMIPYTHDLYMKYDMYAISVSSATCAEQINKYQIIQHFVRERNYMRWIFKGQKSL